MLMLKFPEVAANTEEGDNPFAYIQTTGRLKTDLFKSVFQEFLQTCVKKPALIIADSEKAFWSKKVMIPFYREHDIAIERVNVAREGHIRMAVLDRVIRTFRDMLDNLKIDEEEYTIPLFQAVIRVYNNTKHSDLMGHTPREVYLDEMLERRIVRGRRTENWLKANREGFLIPEGAKVLVRRSFNKFEKRRGVTVLPGEYEVVRRISGSVYEIRNTETGETMTVPRRDIKIDSKVINL